MEVLFERANKWSFDAYTLKMIAIITMVIDHVGVVFFPDLMIFRMIGRITAPIFAFFIAEGYYRTRNVKKYLLRLMLFAVISAVPYALIFHHYFNILFDFAIGLVVLILTDKVKKVWLKWTIVFAGAALAFMLQTDGMLGISVLVYLFHRYRNEPKKMFVSMVILYLCSVVMLVMNAMFSHDLGQLKNFTIWIRPLSVLSLVFVFSYNGQRGRTMKYLFYWFYPVHLFILYMLLVILT